VFDESDLEDEMTTPLSTMAGRIEDARSLDPLARKIGSAVGQVLGPPGPIKDALTGTWLGHALHPALTDVVVGSWTSSLILDIVGGEEAQAGSDALVGVGVLAALPTAATGVADWVDTTGRERRMGLVHGLGNLAAVSLYGASYLLRRRGWRGAGVALSVLGGATATFTAYLGGHLVFDRAVGVNQTATEHRPRRWTTALTASELIEGKPVLARADGEAVMLLRRGGQIHAIAERCSHRGGPLHEGEIDEFALTVTCPWHGSTFRLDDGSVKRGPATAPQPTYEARERDGVIEVRARA
jgi:nitrite reductase/ring-hydroxylating ferredoxin subunit/uncharacterized membrane protein